MNGLQYWKRLDDVFWSYVNHPEAKFDGDTGVLSRKHVSVQSVTHIGKESNNLESTEILGLEQDSYVVYQGEGERLKPYVEKILQAEPKDVKRFRISRQTLRNVKRALQAGARISLKHKTITRLLAYINANY